MFLSPYQLNLIERYANLFTSVLVFVFGFFVFIRNKSQKVNRVFFISVIFVSLWLFCYSLGYSSRNIGEANFWFKCGYIGVVFIPVLMFHFTTVFLNKKDKKTKSFLLLGYLIGAIFISFLLLTRHLLAGLIKYPWGYYPKASLPLHLIFLVYFNTYYISSTIFLFLGFFHRKDISTIERARRRYLFLAWIIGSFAAFDFIPNYGINATANFFPTGCISMTVGYFLIGYTVIRYRLMDIRVAITRAGIFVFIYGAVLGVPFYIGYLTKSWALATSFAVILATVGPIVYRSLQKKAADALLSEQRRYQKILVQAASGMSREHDLNRLAKLIVYIVKRSVRIDFSAIIIEDRDQGVYKLRATRDGVHAIGSSTFSYKDPLVKYLRHKKEPLLYEELPPDLRNSLHFPLRVALIVPSFIEDRLLGFLFLGEKLNRQPYTQDDINVFRILSHQTALAIENCFFFDEFKKAQEKIFTAEKLASIGGMADGVAHQIKNRLNHFSIASGEMKFEIMDFIKSKPRFVEENPELKKTFDYLVNISDSLVNNVKRTDDIIKGILHFARVEEKETFFSYFSLKESIDLSLNLLRVKHEIENIPLVIDLGSSDMIHGVKAQITEAIYNLLDNAYEALQEKKKMFDGDEKKNYNPLIELKLFQEPHLSRIEISDNGIGIKEEDKHRIFAPFFTTKSSYKSGTGIGMYVVQRMIEENHNGKIWFSSEYMQGARIFIELPKKQ